MQKTKIKTKIKLDKIQYLLIGDNNFWYGIESNLKDAKQLKKELLTNNNEKDYDDSKHDELEDIYIYKSQEVLN